MAATATQKATFKAERTRENKAQALATAMPQRLSDLREAAEDGNYERLERLAHRLKGAAGNYGLDEVAPHAAYLESIARERKSEILVMAALEDLDWLCEQILA